MRIESDSRNLINSINKGNATPELYGIVADILSLSSLFESVCFKWIPREENFAADLLAKQVLGVVEALMSST